MDERAARDAVLARAIETADSGREIWSDVDRVWAGRAAAEVVGETAPDDAFVARRATFVLERLAKRHPRVAGFARGPVLRGWVAVAATVVAFVVGAIGVEIGPSHRINLLAPPVLALLAWNLAVYAVLAASSLGSRRTGAAQGPVRRQVTAWFRDVARPLRSAVGSRPLAAALARFTADWTTLATPLWRQRAARLLHLCAASLAAGAIAGLYLRGIALEYRASWQSTFLDAADVARVLHVALAPGSWLTGIPVPGAAHLEAVGGGSNGENAAPWMHLYAATILLVVIIPRLALGTLAWLRERRLSSHFPVALDHAYFRHLLHAWHEGTAHVVAVPYSFTAPRTAIDGFAQLLTRVYQSGVEVAWLPPVPYGSDDIPSLPSPLAAVAVIFSLSATPEPENHGAFVAALAASAAGRAPMLAVVDTSDFVSRFRDHPRRIAERQSAWQQMLAERGVETLFVRLAEPDLADAAAQMTLHLESASS